MKRLIPLLALASLAYGQSGPSVSPTNLSFAYTVNSPTMPATAKVNVTLPTTLAGQALKVTVSSKPPGWLTVTPDSGYAPLALTVSANPTTLTPGSYPGTIVVDTVAGSGNPASVSVTLSITNPPSMLNVLPPPPPGSATRVINFTYTTGDPAPAPTSAELDVSSNGGIIPFNVTAAGSTGTGKSGQAWLLVSNSPTQLPSTTTSGVAISGSSVPIYVTVDPTLLGTLLPGNYAGQITVAAVNAVNGTIPVIVNLTISAGPPTLNKLAGQTPIFPAAIIAGPTVDAVITLYGKNFFSTTVVSMSDGVNPPITLPSTLLSSKVIQATIKAAYLAATGGPYPITWTISVTNPAPPTNPGQGPDSTTLSVLDPTTPGISSVVNAASFLKAASQTGSGKDPVPPNQTAVSPREIISIFGTNLGPATPFATSPSAGMPSLYPTLVGGIHVDFSFGLPATVISAPILLTSTNQINCLVPAGMAAAIALAAPNATITVYNGLTPTLAFPVTVIPEDPGVFTFGGVGLGQAAVINFADSTINSSKATAARGSTIEIYATGLGDFVNPPAMFDGQVATGPVLMADGTARVDIDGQPSVVTYAGMAPGAVAGLVQINAIVPPTAKAGAAVSLTVSIGNAVTARRSQQSVTIGVK
jgi:uncharacterized protein (TIGR03437 family)